MGKDAATRNARAPQREHSTAGWSTPHIIFNSDGDIVLSSAQPWVRRDQLCRGINELEGTQVDVYSYSICTGGDTYGYPSKIAPILGEDLTSLEGLDDWPRQQIETLRKLLETGNDPMEILPHRAHELGMGFWASLRMNDNHDDFPDYAALHGAFRKEHPELLIGSPYPEPKEYGNPEADFCWALDYARKEVRSRQLAIVAEALARYDVDGIELDFLRGPYYFKTNERELGLAPMTDFMRKARTEAHNIAKRKGRPLALAVRVDPTFAACEAKGLDVHTWVKEQLADFFVPMCPGRLDAEADVRGFVEAAPMGMAICRIMTVGPGDTRP